MSQGARSGWSACLLIGLILGIGFVFLAGVGVVGLVVFLRTRPVAAGATPEPGVSTPSASDDPPGDPPSETPSTDDPAPDFTLKTSFTPYTVSGRTASELRADLSSKGPLDSSGRHDAFTRWYVRWTYPHDTSDGQCATGAVHVEVQVTYTLPDWSPPSDTPADVVTRWQRYRRALRTHEDGHRDHGVDAAHEVLRKLRTVAERPTCSDLDRDVNTTANGVLDDYRAKDVAYDKETKHGATQGAVFP